MNVSEAELKLAEGQEHLTQSLMAWHASIVTLDRRKAVVLMNNETRYSVVIYRPTPKDYAQMKNLIPEAIIMALRMEGVSEDVINNYMADAGEIVFSKTANKSLVAKLNHAVDEVAFMQEYLDENSRIQRYISLVTGRFIQTSPNNESFYPIKEMLEQLNLLYGNEKGVLDVELYQLKIQIKLEGINTWRRVHIPSTYSFRHLHNVIQTVFDWQNYHLHRFEAEKEGSKKREIVMNDDPETLEYLNFEANVVQQERFVALKDIFSEYSEVIYEYDFGDSWIHTITLEKRLKSNVFQATYLDGCGERPPEDVGGSWGYQEYIRIMSDPKDPEHEHIKAWAKSQKERKQTAEEINERLKHCLSPYFK